jgi:hypothetical protein
MWRKGRIRSVHQNLLRPILSVLVKHGTDDRLNNKYRTAAERYNHQHCTTAEWCSLEYDCNATTQCQHSTALLWSSVVTSCCTTLLRNGVTSSTALLLNSSGTKCDCKMGKEWNYKSYFQLVWLDSGSTCERRSLIHRQSAMNHDPYVTFAC